MVCFAHALGDSITCREIRQHYFAKRTAGCDLPGGLRAGGATDLGTNNSLVPPALDQNTTTSHDHVHWTPS